MKKVIVIIYSQSKMTDIEFTYLPIGSSIVSSLLDKSKYQVDLYNYDGTDVFPDISDYDYVLFSCNSYGNQYLKRHKVISRKIYENLEKDLLKIDKKTIVGGTLIKNEYDGNLSADVIVNGSVDLNINDLIHKNGYIESKGVDTLGLPIDYNILNIEDFQISHKRIFDRFGISLKPYDDYVSTSFTKYSKGCDKVCAFCNEPTKRPIFLSIEKTKDIIKSYVDNGFNVINFIDTYVNLDTKFMENICNWLVRDNIKLLWSHSTRLDGKDKDFYKMLFDAGCRILYSGLESLSVKMLKEIQKGIKKEVMIKNLEMIHDAGIFNIPNIIVGLPNETKEDLMESLYSIKDIKNIIDGIVVHTFTMYKNTVYHRNPKKWDLVVATSNNYEMIYYEKRTKLKYSETIEKKKQFRKTTKEFLSENGIYPDKINQHLTFALYKQLGSKENVRESLRHNVIL